MSLQREVRKQGLRDSFVKALAKKNITNLYEWQAAALREATAFQGRNFIYQVCMLQELWLLNSVEVGV